MERLATRTAERQLLRTMQASSDPRVRVRAALSLAQRMSPDSPFYLAYVIALTELIAQERDNNTVLQLIDILDAMQGMRRPQIGPTPPQYALSTQLRGLLNVRLSDIGNRLGRITLLQLWITLAGLAALYSTVANLANLAQLCWHVAAVLVLQQR